MNYKNLIAVTISLTVCAFTGSNAMAHGGGGGGHGGGFGGGGFGGRGGGGGAADARAPHALTVGASPTTIRGCSVSTTIGEKNHMAVRNRVSAIRI